MSTFQLLNCDDWMLFFISSDSKWNVFVFWDVFQKTEDMKTLFWPSGHFDGHFSLYRVSLLPKE